MKKTFFILIFLFSFICPQQSQLKSQEISYASDMRNYLEQIKQSVSIIQGELVLTKNDLEKAKQNLKIAEEALNNAILCAEQWGERLQENNEDLTLAYDEIDNIKQELKKANTELNTVKQSPDIKITLYKTLMIISFTLALIGWFIVLLKKIPFFGKLIV